MDEEYSSSAYSVSETQLKAFVLFGVIQDFAPITARVVDDL